MSKKDPEEFVESLMHFGKKGMKWGVRKSKDELRTLDRASKEKTKAGEKKIQEAHTKSVDAARERLSTGKTKSEYKAAKQQYKNDKGQIGKHAAKQALAKAAEKRNKDINKSQEYRNGNEAAKALLLAAAGGVLFTILANS